MGLHAPLALSPSLHVSPVPPPICVAMSRLTALLACLALCFVAQSSAHIRSLWGLHGFGLGYGLGFGYMPYGLGYGGYGLGLGLGYGLLGGIGGLYGGMYGGYGLGHMGGMYY